MKKTVAAIGIALCMMTTVGAQSSSEYEAMNEWLFQAMLNGVTPLNDKETYGGIKEQWYQYGEKIYENVKASLPPIDPSITAAITKLYADHNAEVERRVTALGFASADELYRKVKYGEVVRDDDINAFYSWEEQRSEELRNQKNALTKAYDDELTNRFHAAFVDAVKKLQQNSASMQ